MRHRKTFIAFWIALFFTGLIFNGTAIGQGGPQAKAAASVRVDLNKATSEQLSRCPGMTSALAKAIIDYRSKSGPFKTPEDLMKVKGVTKEILSKLNPKVEKDALYVIPAPPSSDEEEEEPSLKPSKC